jgi:hypothetical protein
MWRGVRHIMLQTASNTSLVHVNSWGCRVRTDCHGQGIPLPCRTPGKHAQWLQFKAVITSLGNRKTHQKHGLHDLVAQSLGLEELDRVAVDLVTSDKDQNLHASQDRVEDKKNQASKMHTGKWQKDLPSAGPGHSCSEQQRWHSSA